MRILLIRLLPALTGIFAALIGVWQWREPLIYPLPFLLFLVWFVVAGALITRGQVGLSDAMSKLLPAGLALLSLGMGYLLTETSFARLCMIGGLVAVSWLSLELMFLLAWDPSRYPVNAISHVNLALVPVSAFFLAAALNGLTTFINLPRLIVLLIMLIFSALMYLCTAHPTATAADQVRWMLAGALFGLQVGILNELLPVNVFVHGALAALVLVIPLRLRRYAYSPAPSVRLAWGEGVSVCLLFFSLLLLSRWA